MIKKKEVIMMFDEEIKIINKWQVVFYLKKGVTPIRVELGYNDRLVFVFLKEDTIRTQCWEQWKQYTIERKWKETLNLYNVPSCDFDLDYDDDYFFNE